MLVRGVLFGVVLGLAVVPASAFKVGYTYVDGSDAVLGESPDAREVFEATIAGELERLGAKGRDSDIADLKGLTHPLYPNGELRRSYICGWVKGFGETTRREFVPFVFLHSESGDFFANIVMKDGDRDIFDDVGCAKAIGL